MSKIETHFGLRVALNSIEAEFLITTVRDWPSNDALGFNGRVVTI
jgi:hypothetical protein